MEKEANKEKEDSSGRALFMQGGGFLRPDVEVREKENNEALTL